MELTNTNVYTEMLDGKRADGMIVVCHYNLKDRTSRAFKQLRTFWLLSFASIFVPMGHFILVPTLFGSGIYMFFHTKKIETSVQEAKIRCPVCSDEQTIKDLPFKFPQDLHCKKCQAYYQLLK